MAARKPIKIKKKNEGKFTAKAKKAGKSVQAEATAVLNDPDASGLQKKRANFAKNAAGWNHSGGGRKAASAKTPARKKKK